MKCAVILSLFLLICLLSGCQEASEEDIPSSPIPSITATITSIAAQPTPIEPTPMTPPEPTRTAKPSTIEICPPLENYLGAELENSIVNPYFPPPPGFDRPHHGVDLAERDELSNVAVTGENVHAILSGEVKMVIPNRFPYGNAILVESVLQESFDLNELLDPIPTPWKEVNPDPALTCPRNEGPTVADEQRSIYILYAHLEQTPSAVVGSVIQCGEVIGNIGMSGNALNPHVHIEARIGPSGAAFESMAHYDGSATPKEMGAYCQWRVSGRFQHFDPMFLLQNMPDTPPR